MEIPQNRMAWPPKLAQPKVVNPFFVIIFSLLPKRIICP